MSKTFIACALLMAGCTGTTVHDGGTGSTMGSGGSTTTGTGAAGGSGGERGDSGIPDADTATDAGVDADMATCPLPPAELGDGVAGPPSCSCHCGVEAPEKLSMMANAAVAAYEGQGTLCLSAPAVPAIILPGGCYGPVWRNPGSGTDFFAFDWACLGVGPALTNPIHCRYSYHAGSGYLGPAAGGPDPGPMGFEVAAEGDFDNNGVHSLFTIAGTFDPTHGTLTLSPLFQHDPLE